MKYLLTKMIKKLKHIFILVLFFNNANATTYYVSSLTGNDNNIGSNITSPLKTIQKGIDKATMANDIVYVMSGTYKETIDVYRNNITVSAYQNNKPIIDGETNLPASVWGSMVDVSGNFNTFSGFEVKNGNINHHLAHGGFGIVISGHDNIVSNNNVHHNWEQGILIHGDNNSVISNTVYLNSYMNYAGTRTSGWGNGIASARNPSNNALIPNITSNAIIKNNIVYNNYGEGIDCFESTNCLVEGNTIYDNWTINLYLSDATNSIYRNNLVYNSPQSSISRRNNKLPSLIMLADELANKPRSSNNKIYNNMLYNGDVNLFSWTGVNGYGLTNVLFSNNTILNGKINTPISSNVSSNSRIINNIIQGVSISSIPSKTGITFSNNNWKITPPTNGIGLGDVIGDPNITKTGNTTGGALTILYFKLSSGSGVINKGKDLSSDYTIDLFGTARPYDNSWDIGAHESIVLTTNPKPVCKMICTTP